MVDEEGLVTFVAGGGRLSAPDNSRRATAVSSCA
jgi:hypothetical protein